MGLALFGGPPGLDGVHHGLHFRFAESLPKGGHTLMRAAGHQGAQRRGRQLPDGAAAVQRRRRGHTAALATVAVAAGAGAVIDSLALSGGIGLVRRSVTAEQRRHEDQTHEEGAAGGNEENGQAGAVGGS